VAFVTFVFALPACDPKKSPASNVLGFSMDLSGPRLACALVGDAM